MIMKPAGREAPGAGGLAWHPPFGRDGERREIRLYMKKRSKGRTQEQSATKARLTPAGMARSASRRRRPAAGDNAQDDTP